MRDYPTPFNRRRKGLYSKISIFIKLLFEKVFAHFSNNLPSQNGPMQGGVKRGSNCDVGA